MGRVIDLFLFVICGSLDVRMICGNVGYGLALCVVVYVKSGGVNFFSKKSTVLLYSIRLSAQVENII
jgi:hypothetical protein